MARSKMDVSIQLKESKYNIWKKYPDKIISFLALLFLSPLLFLVLFSIKCSDWKAPVFFKQERVGKAGKRFYMYKFRTMYVDAEEQLELYLAKNEAVGAMFKLKNDPRITKLGKILRKMSIDEFPQLWNVMKGEMALVGPRPPLPREVAEYTSYDKQRLHVIPGCTGLWQVSGRSELSFQEMVELDLDYIQNVSLKLDIKIICKTFLVIFTFKGAY